MKEPLTRPNSNAGTGVGREATPDETWFASMMTKSLNERQQALLQRIVDGGYRPSSGDATTTYALRSRGLLTTTSAYAYRTAEPTAAGCALIERQHVSDAHAGRAAAAPEPVVVLEVASSHAELLDELARSVDHRLVLTDPTPETRAAWRRLLHATRRQHATDDGMVLRHSGRARGDLVIWLKPRVDTSTTSTTVIAVDVPDRVLRPHPLVAALRTATVGSYGWIDTRRMPDVAHVRIARSSKQRTIRILHALTLEAQRRGHTVESRSGHRCAGGFGISIDGHHAEVTVFEESRWVPHVLTAREKARKARGFDSAPHWDDEATGRLVLRRGHASAGSTLAADRVRWQVEDRLGHVMDQLEQLAVVAEQRHLRRVEAQRHEALSREREQQVAEDAWQLRERARSLDEQIDRWEHATRIRRFVAAARSSMAADAASHDWLDWADTYADSIDPVVGGFAPTAR